MKSGWPAEFHKRMEGFKAKSARERDGTALSIKVRVDSGCFHREHSPHAYAMIDAQLAAHPSDGDWAWEEHESGPEVLVYIAAATVGLGFSAAVINLVTAIVKARSDGVKKGDDRVTPVEVIVRRSWRDGEVTEEKILRFHPRDPIERKVIEQKLQKAAKKLLSDDKPSKKSDA